MSLALSTCLQDSNLTTAQCSRIAQLCVVLIVWIVENNDKFQPVLVALAVQNGLLSGILFASPWVPNKFIDSIPVSGVSLFRSMDECLEFLGEGLLVRYLWIYPIFIAVAAALQDIPQENTTATNALYQNLIRLVTRWQPIALQVSSRTDLIPQRCCNSEVHAMLSHSVHGI
jgi:hypothetical protein